MFVESHPVFIGIKKRKIKPADAGRNGQAVREGERMRYYDKLDDYADADPSKINQILK